MGLIHDLAAKEDLASIQAVAKEKGLEFIRKARDLWKNSVLHIATQKSSMKIVQYCLDIEIDLNAYNVAGDTALIIAAKNQNFELIKKLTEAGADVDQANGVGNTSLHYACFWRCNDIALFLAKTASAQIKIANKYNQTPLFHTKIAKVNGHQLIQAKLPSLDSDKKELETLTISWSVQPSAIDVAEALSETPISNWYRGKCAGQEVTIIVPKIRKELANQDIDILKMELSALKKLQNINISALQMACITPPDICYMISYTDQGNLATMLGDSNIEMTASDSLKLAVQVAKGLVYLHELKPPVVHGNLKTSNILLWDKNSITLSDFGFSKSIFQKTVAQPLHYYEPEWMAPEQLLDQKVDDYRLSDIYTFGLVLFAIITRQRLYEITNPMVIGYMIAELNIQPDIPEFVPNILVTIVDYRRG
ncbi:hypothetical protein HDV01_000581 [Terramyces sp. JEL0728]|nr:hypothetical protein HDV01_000581 [Terramyces sp. JEL0728]